MNRASKALDKHMSMMKRAGLYGLLLAFALAWTSWCDTASAETITVNGVKRTFSVRLAEAKPAPLVVVLHGNTQTGADMASRT
jgi:polyhydroxybutyrate depolymerase